MRGRHRTALCIAARYGALDCINVLNEHSANSWHRDDEGLTALEAAERGSRQEAAALLRRMQQASLPLVFWCLGTPPGFRVGRVQCAIALSASECGRRSVPGGPRCHGRG